MKIEVSKYNDVWLDNGLVTFYQVLKTVEGDSLAEISVDDNELRYKITNEKEFIEELAETIKSKLHHMIVIEEDKKTGTTKEVKKDHILVQEGKKIGGKVAFKETIFDETQIEQVVQEIIENLNGDKYHCFFCNRPFKKNVKKIQQASYPFVTKIKSLSGIRTGESIKLTEYISEYCPQCYLNGIMEWLDDSMVYRNLPRNKSILVLPNTEKLSDLIKLKQSYVGILNNEARWSNIKIDRDRSDVENTSGKYSTFVSFYENFLRYVEPDFDNQNWFVIEIPQGSVKNPKYFNVFVGDEIATVLKILIRTKNSYFYRTFIKEYYAFNTDPKKGVRNFDYERELHEKSCESLIENNFNQFASCFAPRKGIKPGLSKDAREVLDQLIYYWRIEQMQIENKENYLKTLGMAGSTLAKLISGRLGLFFKLEKAKNPNQFFEALKEISRRVVIDDTEKIGKIYPHSLEKVSQMILEKYDQKDGREFFETTKNILLIYTSLRSKKGKQTNEEARNEQ